MKSFIPKYLTLHWAAFATLMIWFLFVHSPPILVASKVLYDPPFALHLGGAYTVYLVCAWNTVFTPSTLDGDAKVYHIWIGRIGMVAGLISFALGAVCAWWPTRDLPPIGFSIGISAGGLGQLFFQYTGFTAIRRYRVLKEKIQSGSPSTDELILLQAEKDECLKLHVYNMCGLFIVGCGAPAGIRLLSAMYGDTSTIALIATVIVLICLVRPFGDIYLKKEDRTGDPASVPLLPIGKP